MPKTKVIHVREGISAQGIYIGRANGKYAWSKWANPFIINELQDRATVIALYTDYLLRNPELMRSIPELVGKTLVCWCSPKSCHGNVLADLANEYDLFGQITFE